MRPRIAFRSRSTAKRTRGCMRFLLWRAELCDAQRTSQHTPEARRSSPLHIPPSCALTPNVHREKTVSCALFRAVILGKKLPLRGNGVQSKHSLRNRAISLRGGTKSYEAIILHSPASVEPSHKCCNRLAVSRRSPKRSDIIQKNLTKSGQISINGVFLHLEVS
jgi:hypothetical protein